jgi:hypothetical protein
MARSSIMTAAAFGQASRMSVWRPTSSCASPSKTAATSAALIGERYAQSGHVQRRVAGGDDAHKVPQERRLAAAGRGDNERRGQRPAARQRPRDVPGHADDLPRDADGHRRQVFKADDLAVTRERRAAQPDPVAAADRDIAQADAVARGVRRRAGGHVQNGVQVTLRDGLAAERLFARRQQQRQRASDAQPEFLRPGPVLADDGPRALPQRLRQQQHRPVEARDLSR